jgi:hypothetical protein
MERKVELRAAKIPGIIGIIAVHYWLVIIQDNQFTRWEIWQRANRGKYSWGHLHKNLMPYHQGVGNGDSWIEFQWFGTTADLLIEIIQNTPQTYPYNYQYRYYPGPNSNTYVQWVLNHGKTNYLLSKKGIGKNFS